MDDKNFGNVLNSHKMPRFLPKEILTKQKVHDLISVQFPVVDLDTDLDWVQKELEERGEEFCLSFHFSQKMLNRYCYGGFLPMGMSFFGKDLLALKLHKKRVLVPPGDVKIKNNILSKFTDCQISFDTAFDQCIQAINKYHYDSWLSDPLIRLFQKSNRQTGKKAKLHSVELWKDNILIAGEIGLTVGSSYTSLSGFHTVSSSGSVQLYALGQLLRLSGFKLWDMGMYAPYKISIGGKLFSRESFLQILASARDDKSSLPVGRTSIAFYL